MALEVNDKGQYCGKSYAKLVSTLGVRCRQTIGLSYKNWKEVNPTLKNKVWKDIQLEEKLSQGQIQVQGQNDILTQALGTPEHPGRVRATGFLTRASQLFGRKKREVSDVVARQAKEIEKLKAEVQSLKQQRNAAEQEEEGEVAGEAYVPQPYAPQDEVQPQTYVEEFISLNDQGILYNFDDHAALNQQVHLCSDNIDNIVARGYLYEHVGIIQVHCQNYDDSHARIMVSEILQEDAEIPVPIEECRYVRDVYQMFLPWPTHLILTTEVTSLIN
ncbi:uncharacterized protein LOC133038498 [Cannabis sativa]|uniref:uncharacterized protein LOC133038498 n=1 Tax=Cannabis sativa TaxID=3483 RepID=UPI0029CA72D8|nr:uncharacterized protein LOC133038498 [Cannabis sativa]